MCSGKGYQLLRRGGQTKRLEMLTPLLPNVNNELVLFVTEFKSKRCNG
jgi:hypothetical protein